MAANGDARQELLRNMQDVEQITHMLTKLKGDLKKKEGLLLKMEDALTKSEERLQKKVSEIEEKTKRLDEVEEKLLKRQEELSIQEKEVQTNAILEFLSFQAREMEIQERMKTAPDPMTAWQTKVIQYWAVPESMTWGTTARMTPKAAMITAPSDTANLKPRRSERSPA